MPGRRSSSALPLLAGGFVHTQWLPATLVPSVLRVLCPGTDERMLMRAQDRDTRLLKAHADIADASRGGLPHTHSAVTVLYDRNLRTGNAADVDVKGLLHLLANVEGVHVPEQAGPRPESSHDRSEKRLRTAKPTEDEDLEITGAGPCQKTQATSAGGSNGVEPTRPSVTATRAV